MSPRIRDYGIVPGRLPAGPGNRITDVPGVRVGHCTLRRGAVNTGVTVVLPGLDNPFVNRYTAAAYVHNGFGKTCGLMQVQELGSLETPIALTNTLNVGRVADALVTHTLARCQREGVAAQSINPVVGECNDCRLNDIAARPVGLEHLLAAIDSAGEDFAEGGVGAGCGTVCYGLKGGIGSASRRVSLGGRTYTLGALVQSNFGATADLVIAGQPVGERILARLEPGAGSAQDRGSIMTVIATDLPLSARQLCRVIRRAGVGIARTGAHTGHGSGEVMIGFTTANRQPAAGAALTEMTCLREDLLETPFQAAAEAVHEAILNSLAAAEPATALDGSPCHALSEFLPGALGL